jgi:hypothetical protein
VRRFNFVIDPANADSNNTVYNSNVPGGGNYYQENTIITEGYNGKLSLMLQPLTKDKLYIGINLNSHFTDFRKQSSFYEDNAL